MADYKRCIPIIIQAEGKYSNDPADSGGPTKWGVCLTFAKDTGDLELFDKDGNRRIDINDIKKLSIDDASEIFKKYFWDKFKLDDEESNKKALVI